MSQFTQAMLEFPEWDVAYSPPIPSAWVETSWHNDACPSWRAYPTHELSDVEMQTARLLVVFVDFLDPAQRDVGDGPRYSVDWSNADGTCCSIFGSDDWDQVLAHVADLIAKETNQ